MDRQNSRKRIRRPPAAENGSKQLCCKALGGFGRAMKGCVKERRWKQRDIVPWNDIFPGEIDCCGGMDLSDQRKPGGLPQYGAGLCVAGCTSHRGGGICRPGLSERTPAQRARRSWWCSRWMSMPIPWLWTKEKRTTRPQNGRCVIPSRPGRITGAIRICRAGALPAGCFFSSFPRRTGGILSTSASN